MAQQSDLEVEDSMKRANWIQSRISILDNIFGQAKKEIPMEIKSILSRKDLSDIQREDLVIKNIEEMLCLIHDYTANQLLLANQESPEGPIDSV